MQSKVAQTVSKDVYKKRHRIDILVYFTNTNIMDYQVKAATCRIYWLSLIHYGLLEIKK